jgi:hypothetical protein
MRLETPPTTILQDRGIPVGAKPTGSAALVQALGVSAPMQRLSCVSEHHIRGSQREEGD